MSRTESVRNVLGVGAWDRAIVYATGTIGADCHGGIAGHVLTGRGTSVKRRAMAVSHSVGGMDHELDFGLILVKALPGGFPEHPSPLRLARLVLESRLGIDEGILAQSVEELADRVLGA